VTMHDLSGLEVTGLGLAIFERALTSPHPMLAEVALEGCKLDQRGQPLVFLLPPSSIARDAQPSSPTTH
jgi:hypothetical protein